MCNPAAPDCDVAVTHRVGVDGFTDIGAILDCPLIMASNPRMYISPEAVIRGTLFIKVTGWEEIEYDPPVEVAEGPAASWK